MRIAHLLGSLGVGGGERVALDLAAGQRAHGHDVTVLSLEEPPDGPMAAEYAARAIPTRKVRKRPGVDATVWPRLALEFARLGVDVVHTHNPPPLIYGAPAAQLARAVCVHTKHGANAMPGRRRWLAQAAARFCDAFVAVSAATAEQARRQREVDERKLTTIENGIDLSRFVPSREAKAAARATLPLPAEAFVVGTVGRLVREKNQPLLIRALAPLLSERLRLVLIGDGPERATVEAAIAALGERARFVQLLGARRDVPQLLAGFDVFALSSDSEGLPLVIIEAMAAALPVIATAVGGIPAVLADANDGRPRVGFLVQPGDAEGLAASVSHLAASPELALLCGAEGRRRALAGYSAERMVDDYVALYERTLRHKGKRAR